MVDEWVTHKTADLIEEGKLFIGDGYRAKNSELSPAGIPFARAGTINQGFRFADSDCFPIENLNRVGNKISEPGDVVFTSKGTVGRFAFVRTDTPRFVFSPQLCFWRSTDPNLIDSRFLFYWMFGREFFVQFKSVAGQTDMAEYVSLGDQRSMHITLPDIGEQRAIAHILGTLDDTIELNRQMNQTLEDMARALFRSWFVDFDPVRAKAEDRDTGLPKHIADLFPDSFEESELGEIPKGWRLGAVREIAEINSSALRRTDSLDVVDYVEISEVMRGDIGEVTRYARGEEPSRARRRLTHGDTVLSTVRPDRGAHFLCLDPPPTLIASTGFAVCSPKETSWAFLYSALTQPGIGEELGRLAHGGAYPAIRPDAVGGLSLVLPPGDFLYLMFQESAGRFFQRSELNRTESKALTKVRDTLLPKLISGELRVKDAERFVEEVV